MTSTPAAAAGQPEQRITVMRQARQADSARRRQRVIAAITRAAGVDHSFLYRHRGLLAQIHALETTPPATGDGPGPALTRAWLHADPTDRGVTRTASRFTLHCKDKLGIRQSTGQVGSWFDNAAAQSFSATLEHELRSRHHVATRAQACRVVLSSAPNDYAHAATQPVDSLTAP